ncbi:MAG: hypothetical protein QM831_03875 [Kofleriaceae bacterium]
MRILPAALGLSVVIHGALIAWALEHDLEQPPVVTATAQAMTRDVEIEVVPAKAPDPEPVAVALLDDHTVTTPPPPRSGVSAISTSHATAHATSHEVAPTTTTTTTPDQPHSKYMGMRPEPKKDLKGPSEDFWKKFDENTKPLQPAAIEGQRIEDDLHSAEEHLGNWRWVANASADELAAERERVLAARQAREDHELKQHGAGYEAQHATFKADVEPDGTAHIERKRSYDPTEIIMRRNNIDPYSSNKKQFLDKTRDERYEIGKEYKKKQLLQSAVIAQKNLAYLWAKVSDAQERKDELFAMWDECAETGTDELVAGGAAARAQIVGFIRAKKTDGQLVFTEAELAAYNAKKKSSAPFAPYAE